MLKWDSQKLEESYRQESIKRRKKYNYVYENIIYEELLYKLYLNKNKEINVEKIEKLVKKMEKNQLEEYLINPFKKILNLYECRKENKMIFQIFLKSKKDIFSRIYDDENDLDDVINKIYKELPKKEKEKTKIILNEISNEKNGILSENLKKIFKELKEKYI